MTNENKVSVVSVEEDVTISVSECVSGESSSIGDLITNDLMKNGQAFLSVGSDSVKVISREDVYITPSDDHINKEAE